MALQRPQKTILPATTMKIVSSRVAPAVLVMVALSLIVFHKTAALPIERLRVALTDVVAPVLSAVSQPFVSASESFEGLRTLRALKAENIRLREENEKLKEWYEVALRFQAENQSLHDLLNVKADPSFKFITTRIVSDPGGSFVKSALLPVGRLDGVHKGNAVMSGRGLIGRVTEVGRHSSRVLLVSDLNSRIPVTIQNTRTRAILAGKNEDMLKLERLPLDSGIVVGSRIMTSGDGGQLPPDIPIGTIVTAGPDGVFVKPLADLSALSYVQIINTDIDPALETGDISEHDLTQ